ncbi:zinc ribbon domain-containing protein [Gemmatimonas aurantiaca]|uniref:zinc ribbon domain-containing protein n=1 Tax=Gemmatimonas aurantiaca TaxID=173480 RepID=UPI00301D1F7F
MTKLPAFTTCPACGVSATGRFCQQCGAVLGGVRCRHCEAPLSPGARFCNECGAPAGAGTSTAPRADTTGRSGMWLPWTIAGGLLVAAVAWFAMQASRATDGLSAAPLAGGVSAPGATDISQMSPRERASRLYDRIMRYTEAGQTDSVQFFAPMALGSFEALGADLDTDARYDYGRVAQEVGDLDLAAAQADTILKAQPTHLLGLALAARTATLQGKRSEAAAYWQRFTAAKNAELQKALPEYQAHRSDIDRAAELAR